MTAQARKKKALEELFSLEAAVSCIVVRSLPLYRSFSSRGAAGGTSGGRGFNNEVLMAKGFVTINEVYCKGCGLCIEACPQKEPVLADRLTRKGYHPAEPANERCTGCANCALVCPDAAITVVRRVRAGAKKED